MITIAKLNFRFFSISQKQKINEIGNTEHGGSSLLNLKDFPQFTTIEKTLTLNFILADGYRILVWNLLELCNDYQENNRENQFQIFFNFAKNKKISFNSETLHGGCNDQPF